MKLFILGGTGNTGAALVEQGLARGHQMTTFGRKAVDVPGGNGAVTSKIGDPMNADQLAAALGGHDVVLSVLGTRGLGGGGTTVLVDAAAATTKAMQTANVRRLVIVSSTLSDPNQDWLPGFLAKTLLKHHAADQRAMESVVTATSLDWTIVRPPRLTNGALTKQLNVADEQLTKGASSMSRKDVAHCMLDIAESGNYKRKVVWVRR